MLYDDAFLTRVETALRAALPVWGIEPDAPLRLLAVSENATFLSEHPARGKVVLRAQRPGYNSADEILSELRWIAALQAEGVVETAAPLPTRTGELLAVLPGTEMYVAAFDFLEGVPPDQTGALPAWFARLGAITACMHRHARRWRPAEGFRRRAWTWEATVGPAADWGDWQRAPGIDGDGRRIVQTAADRLRTTLAAHGTGPDRFGLIHADMRPGNLLADGDRLGVIDFDDCGFGWFAFDFAASVSLMEADPALGDLQDAWLTGYASVAPLSPEDRAMLPAFVMLRRIQLTAWGATHAETPTGARAGRAYAEGTVDLAERFLTNA